MPVPVSGISASSGFLLSLRLNSSSKFALILLTAYFRSLDWH